jgi:hypothetical protein
MTILYTSKQPFTRILFVFLFIRIVTTQSIKGYFLEENGYTKQLNDSVAIIPKPKGRSIRPQERDKSVKTNHCVIIQPLPGKTQRGHKRMTFSGRSVEPLACHLG